MGAPSDNTTLVELTAALRGDGYRGSLSATPEGSIRCSECGNDTSPGAFDLHRQRRLEGASDPADEMLVVAGSCGACGARGVLLLGYGPAASAADAAVVEQLPSRPG